MRFTVLIKNIISQAKSFTFLKEHMKASVCLLYATTPIKLLNSKRLQAMISARARLCFAAIRITPLIITASPQDPTKPEFIFMINSFIPDVSSGIIFLKTTAYNI